MQFKSHFKQNLFLAIRIAGYKTGISEALKVIRDKNGLERLLPLASLASKFSLKLLKRIKRFFFNH